jgi:N-methylhydantoinase A
MPFGGAGPTHAGMLADEARVSRIVVPPSPGTFCALGAVMADIRRDFAQSRRLTLGQDEAAGAAFLKTLEGLEDQARAWIAEEGDKVGEVSLEVTADMQYPRTAFVLTIQVPEEVWRSGDAQAIAELFHAEHERLYAFRHADNPVDVTTVRLRVNGKAPAVHLPALQAGETPRPIAQRQVYAGADGWVSAAVFERGGLPGDVTLDGPAIVEQEDSTVWVPPGWCLATDRQGCLHLTHAPDGASHTGAGDD